MILQTDGPSLASQHLRWLLSQPEPYIFLILYLSVIAIWFWSIRKVFFQRKTQKRYKAVFVFYSLFMFVFVGFLYGQFRIILGVLSRMTSG